LTEGEGQRARAGVSKGGSNIIGRQSDRGTLTDPCTTGRLSTGARWSITVISLFVTASSFLFINGIAFMIPALEARRGIPLTEAGLIASMPSWGMVVTLVVWG
jgi:hypothetical protein